jgi:hypothetical protein
VPCFNVTSDDFDAPTASSTPSASATGTTSDSSIDPVYGISSGGLSTGAKAGIAVGSIIGGLAILGGIAFLLYRRGRLTGLQNREEYELRAKKLDAGQDELPPRSA